LRLRGRVGVLEQELSTNSLPGSHRAAPPTTGSALTLTLDDLQDAGASTPQTAVESFLWAGKNKQGKRAAELLDWQSIKDNFFVRLRQITTGISVADAERIATEVVEKAKARVDFLGRDPATDVQNVAAFSIGRAVETGFDPGVVLVKVASVYRDGHSDSESLKLRQVNGSYLIVLDENQMGISAIPVRPAGSNQPASGVTPPKP
jgi:hypothetical protein